MVRLTLSREGKCVGAISVHRVLNDVLKSDGNSLMLAGFTFDLRESEAELNRRLKAPPEKRKR